MPREYDIIFAMGRKIIVGVTGSIAAYKAAELVRLFIKGGDTVTCIMTEAATKFITPLTLQTLSRNPVYIDQFAPPVSWQPEHISLADSADLIVVAPATANTIAKMRFGLADNLLTATLLATKAKIVVAPVMNTGMLENPVTQENIRVLEGRGVTIVDPDSGELACGATGKGRMPEAEEIYRACQAV